MAKNSPTVVGGFQVLADNTELVQQMTRKAIKNALEECGETAVNLAQDSCPVKTGNLRDSITKKVHGAAFVEIGTSNVPYAKKVETDDTLKHTNGKAHFLRDSVNGRSDLYNGIFRKHMQNA